MDLAALDIKIGADLTKLQKDLNSAGVYVDNFTKDLASIGSNSAAAAGGMQAIAAGAEKISIAFKDAPAGIQALEQSLDSFANEFNSKWDKIIDEATKLPVVIDDTSESAKRLQRQFAAFGSLSPFKNAGADLSKFSLATRPIPQQLQNTSKASNSATQALGNLGRVAQDLPFGFLGIANNLNPLLEGFQRLGTEAKATGTSVSSLLVKSLTGAGGLGIALSVVSAALTFASVGMSAWTRGFGHNKKAIDEAKEALDGYLKNAAGEITSLRVLEKVATDTTNAYSVRKKAVDELQKSYPAYLGNLSDEAILNGAAADAINEVAAALAKKAYLQASESTLTSLANQQLKARQEELKLIGQQQQAELDLAKAKFDASKAGPTLGGSGLTAGTTNNAAAAAIDRAKGKLEEVGKELKKNRGIQQGLNNDFTYFLNIAEQFKADTIKLDPDPNGKAKKTVETIADVLAKLKLELSALDARELYEGLNLSDEKIRAIESVISKLITDFKVPADSTIIQKLFGDINSIKFGLANFREFIQRLEKTIPAEKAPKIPIKISPVFDKAGFEAIVTKARAEILAGKFGIELPVNWSVANTTEIDNIITKINAAKTALEGLNKTIISVVESGLINFFTSIGNSLAGSENPFEAFATIMANGLKAIGQSLIQYGVQVGIIQKVLANPLNPISPVLAIAAGIALTAIGAALERNIKITGLAEGGIIPPGYPNDTYLARLSSNEAVIPLDKGLGKYLEEGGPMAVELTGQFEMQGDKLIAFIDRAQKKYKRTY